MDCHLPYTSSSLAVDSSHTYAYSNQKSSSDKDARGRVKKEDKLFFGYKLHASVIPENFPLPTYLEVSSKEAFDGKL